ncbi:cytochrome b [Sphingomonas sp. FW199]|uniref:cytochrome b n=1 Tax=Sphingomonas sp. FW199 TaxID=3400217 RepID=UPI003CEEAC2A
MTIAAARYGSVARAFHWAIAVAILINLPLGLFGDAIQQVTGPVMPTHKSIGLTVLALSIARLVWRLGHPAPPEPAGMGALERRVAPIIHWALYALMILVPLTGYAMSSAGNRPLDWFGLFPVAKLPVTRDTLLYELSHEGHEILGLALGALAIGHILAALRHHFILKDGVLRRMIG